MDDCMLYICCTLVCLKDSGGQFAQVCATLLDTGLIVCTHTIAFFGESIVATRAPSLCYFAPRSIQRAARTTLTVNAPSTQTQRLWSRRSAGRRRQFKKWRQMSRSPRYWSYHTNFLRLYRYTIQTYPKRSVGWLVLSTAWFLCPQATGAKERD